MTTIVTSSIAARLPIPLALGDVALEVTGLDVAGRESTSTDSAYLPVAGILSSSGTDASSIEMSFEAALILVAMLALPFLRVRPSYSSCPHRR